ncbi:hypothetical protein HPB47_027278 [Ixodes persulcatus]|uniref:Uncharacterized protein n=1 Tax=Ixodes persulcatus TaxID=34615 RepID=A0AC60PXR1_IXOPE|nr:hypothetical protein HPB47_027278 [Ixodes persulcatus]
MEKTTGNQVAFLAILPREVSLRKNNRWAVIAEVLQQHNDEAMETNFIDGSRQSWSALCMLDGVHLNKKGSMVFGRILRGGIPRVVACHEQEAKNQEWSRHAAEEKHQELRRQYGDQAKELAEFSNGGRSFGRGMSLPSVDIGLWATWIPSLASTHVSSSLVPFMQGTLMREVIVFLEMFLAVATARETGRLGDVYDDIEDDM